MNKQDLIDRVTSEVMKIYNVQPSSPAVSTPAPNPAPPRHVAAAPVITNVPEGTQQLKALALVCGNNSMKQQTIERFKELRNRYRQTKVLLSDNARNVFQATASRPFAGFEYMFGDAGVDELQSFDHFHIINPTINTLSKMASMQSDNPVALVAKRALLWGKTVSITMDQIPSYPEGMMDEFNHMIQKLNHFGYQFQTDLSSIQTKPAATSYSAPAPALNRSSMFQTSNNLAGMIDHTLLKAEATKADVDKILEEAMQYSFFSVCVNPDWVPYCAQRLKGSSVKVCTVIGFPLGATTSGTKAFETREAIQNGADEIDMVMNIGRMKNKDYDGVKADIKAVVDAAAGTTVKVILETSLLTREEIIIGCRLSKEAGAHFVKTSTGFSTGGATVEHIQLMRTVVGPEMGVKASGGVRSTEFAKALAEAGASRIGASASVAICTGADAGAGKY